MWEEKKSMKIGGFVKNAPSYLPAQSDSNNSLQEEVFFLQINTFALKLRNKLKIIDFSNMWKKFSIKIGELIETDYA